MDIGYRYYSRACNTKGEKITCTQPIDSTLGHIKVVCSSGGYGGEGQPLDSLSVGDQQWISVIVIDQVMHVHLHEHGGEEEEEERSNSYIPTDDDV